MKFVINHSEYFTDKNVVFCIALSSFWINILAEVINLYMLAYQHNVEHCIIHFVALEVIVEIPHILMGSLTNDKLKNRIWQRFHSLQTTNKGRDFVFSERDMVNKIGRVLYRVARGFYVSILFYFQPFIVMAIYLMMIESGDIIHHHWVLFWLNGLIRWNFGSNWDFTFKSFFLLKNCNFSPFNYLNVVNLNWNRFVHLGCCNCSHHWEASWTYHQVLCFDACWIGFCCWLDHVRI